MSLNCSVCMNIELNKVSVSVLVELTIQRIVQIGAYFTRVSSFK